MPRHCNLPYHFYINVDNVFLGEELFENKTSKAIWHGVYCRPDQALMLHVMLESGAHWTGLPIHSISTNLNFKYNHTELMPWACMGENIEAVKFNYLEGLKCETINPINEEGRHTGILIDWNDGYSRYPQEHKPLNLIHLNCGQFALLPNNFVIYYDKHFINEDRKDLKRYLRGDKIYWGE